MLDFYGDSNMFYPQMDRPMFNPHLSQPIRSVEGMNSEAQQHSTTFYQFPAFQHPNLYYQYHQPIAIEPAEGPTTFEFGYLHQ